jgi:hypothetical protein
MSYIDNRVITVNAVLTKKGRELLAQNGALQITSFALADDEIDYSLYNPNHPQGSAYYDLAIRNTPIMEPVSDETQVLKYKLVTLNPGVTSIPVITLGQTSIEVDKNYRGEIVIVPSTNPVYNTTLGYTAILANKNAGRIIGELVQINQAATIPSFLGDIGSTTAQTAVGLRFRFIPNNGLTSTLQTNLTIIGNESGGSVTIPVVVNVDTNA